MAIVVVLTSVIRARNKNKAQEGSGQRAQLENFDPGDVLHIMAASSPEAFEDPFPVSCVPRRWMQNFEARAEGEG